jgi:hypothetical protein
MRLDLQVRSRMFSQPADEFEQSWQIGGGLQSASHLAAEISVDHPRRDGLPDIGTAKVQVLHVPAAEFAHDTEIMLTKERMERIPNRNFALVTGIITCRL